MITDQPNRRHFSRTLRNFSTESRFECLLGCPRSSSSRESQAIISQVVALTANPADKDRTYPGSTPENPPRMMQLHVWAPSADPQRANRVPSTPGLLHWGSRFLSSQPLTFHFTDGSLDLPSPVSPHPGLQGEVEKHLAGMITVVLVSLLTFACSAYRPRIDVRRI